MQLVLSTYPSICLDLGNEGEEGKVPRKGITLIKEKIWTSPTWTSRFGRRNRTNTTQSSRLTGPRIIIPGAAVREFVLMHMVEPVKIP
jgi:hypothetical protein